MKREFEAGENILKDKCPYCKGLKYKGSKSCDECYRKGKFRGKLTYTKDKWKSCGTNE